MAKTTILLILFFTMISARSMGAEESDFLWQVQHIKNMDYSSGTTGERADRFKKYFLKIHNFTYNYGSKLLYQLNDGKILNGHELNLIHETLSSYLLVSKKLNSFLKELSPKSRSSFLRLVTPSKLQTNFTGSNSNHCYSSITRIPFRFFWEKQLLEES